jgi:hypothetical protein
VTREEFVQAGLSIGVSKPGEALSLFMRWWDIEFPDNKCPHNGPVPLQSLRLFFERAEEAGAENMRTKDGARLIGYASGRHESIRRMLQYYSVL